MLAGFVIRGAAVGAAAALDMRVACSCGGGGGGGGGSTGGTSSRAAQLPVPPALPTLTQRLHDASDVQTALMADLERAARGALAAML